MKKILLSAIAVFALAAGAFAQDTVTKTYNFGEFNGVKAGYVHEIHLTKGNSDKIEVTCPERLVKYQDYKVLGGTLYLNMEVPNRFRLKEDEKIVVNIQMEDIRLISLSGASGLTPKGRFSGKNVELKMSGASSMKGTLFLDADYLTYGFSGASEGAISGTFSEVKGELSGASELDIEADVKTYDMEASGASSCNFTGKAESVRIECSGASEIDLEGSTTDISIECSGASEVDAEHMTAVNAYATASGASSVRVYGDNTLELHTSGSSSIKYYGAAKDLRISNKSISRGR